jgi:hypothetical protein
LKQTKQDKDKRKNGTPKIKRERQNGQRSAKMCRREDRWRGKYNSEGGRQTDTLQTIKKTIFKKYFGTLKASELYCSTG